MVESFMMRRSECSFSLADCSEEDMVLIRLRFDVGLKVLLKYLVMILLVVSFVVDAIII